jgi:hypothetical protein
MRNEPNLAMSLGTVRRLIALFAVLLCFPAMLPAEGPTSLAIIPRVGADVPFGPDDEGTDLFTFGASVGVTGDFSLPFSDSLSAAATLLYGFHPTSSTAGLSLISIGVGPALTLAPAPILQIRSELAAGLYVGMREATVAANPFVLTGLDFQFALNPGLSINTGVTYKYYVTRYEGSLSALYHGLGIQAGVTLRPGSSASRIEFGDILFDPVFPVFFKYYDTHPLGSVVIRNGERVPVRDARVSFFISQYMDRPKVCAVIEELKPGGELQIPLYALFTDRVLEITEATVVTAAVSVSYALGSEERSGERSEAVRILDRNAMTWDDDQKAASFVTAKDPTVLRFAKNIAGTVRDEGTRAVNLNFRTGLALFEALSLYGMNYVVDPKTPYTSFSENKFAVDYLQFPQQSLVYKAGDCDDLSILYATLLEAVGIETAFITVPGHIYTAFSLDMTAEEARKTFRYEDDLIFSGGTAWLPVEVTQVSKDFLTAWRTGAKTWREHSADGAAALFPVHEAWTMYEPVGIGGDNPQVLVPPGNQLLSRYETALETFIAREIQPQVEDLRRRIAGSNNSPRLINRLGTLYARFGLFDQAEAEFLKVTGSRQPYVPAVVNLGNLSLIAGDLQKSQGYYERAASLEPDNMSALLGLARISYERGDQAAAKDLHARVETIDPELAARFAYLAGGEAGEARAEAAAREEGMVWDED